MPAKKPPPTSDPVVFWQAQYEQAVKDATRARTKAPSVLPKLVQLERDAWRELQSALAGVPLDDAAAAPVLTLEGELAEVRAARLAATAKGGMTATVHLLKREGEIAAAIRVRDEAAAKARRREMGKAEFLAALVTKILAMPEGMRAELRAALKW